MWYPTNHPLKSRVRQAVTRTVVVAASTLPLLAASGFAALPQEPKTPTPPRTVEASPAAPVDIIATARQALERAKANQAAGIDNFDEVEEARTALDSAVASTQLLEARTALERQKVMVTTGVAPLKVLAEGELTITEREMVLYQVQTDHWQRVTERLRAEAAQGTASTKELNTATQKLGEAQMQFTATKARYTTQKIAVLKTRLDAQQERQRAGIAPQSDVDKARADYENALAENVKLK